jgi:hypothetical protein
MKAGAAMSSVLTTFASGSPFRHTSSSLMPSARIQMRRPKANWGQSCTVLRRPIALFDL